LYLLVVCLGSAPNTMAFEDRNGPPSQAPDSPDKQIPSKTPPYVAESLKRRKCFRHNSIFSLFPFPVCPVPPVLKNLVRKEE